MGVKENTKFDKIKYYLYLHILILIYSFSGIFSKFAAKRDFLSSVFCLLYIGVVFVLGIYAVGWQQIIKHLPLTTAYSNKAAGIVWGIVWGTVIFQEQIELNMIIGAIIVVGGVVLVVKSDE